MVLHYEVEEEGGGSDPQTSRSLALLRALQLAPCLRVPRTLPSLVRSWGKSPACPPSVGGRKLTLVAAGALLAPAHRFWEDSMCRLPLFLLNDLSGGT